MDSLDFDREVDEGGQLLLALEDVHGHEDFFTLGVLGFPDPTIRAGVADTREGAFRVGVVSLGEAEVDGGDLRAGAVGNVRSSFTLVMEELKALAWSVKPSTFWSRSAREAVDFSESSGKRARMGLSFSVS